MIQALSFAPPRFLTLPSISVDISADRIRFAESITRAGQTSISVHTDEPLLKDLAEKDIIEWGPALTNALQSIQKRANVSFAHVTLPEEYAYVFQATIKSDTPEKNWKDIISFKLTENVPLPAAEVVFDYEKISVSGNKTTVSVVAYRRDVLQMYQTAFISAGLQPISFELEVQAIARAVVPDNMTGASMLVNIGRQKTAIGIVYQGALLYTATVPFGGKQFSLAVQKVTKEEQSEAELVRIQRAIGLSAQKEGVEIYEALLSAVSGLRDELSVRMQYWHTYTDHDPLRRISTILLSGEYGALKQLPTYFSESLGVATYAANVWGNVYDFSETVPDIPYVESLGHATVIGSALRADTIS